MKQHSESTVSTARAERRFPDEALARRVVIEQVRPALDNGRFAVKRTVGERVTVAADIFADGHDVLVASVRDRHLERARAEGADLDWRETPMVQVAPGTD